VPGLKSDAESIAPWITDINITKIYQASVLFSPCEILGEISTAEADFADIEVTNAVVGMTRGRKASGCP
jgi:hypothetical protein